MLPKSLLSAISFTTVGLLLLTEQVRELDKEITGNLFSTRYIMRMTFCLLFVTRYMDNLGPLELVETVQILLISYLLPPVA